MNLNTKSFFQNYGAGILLAATGVGAGDLITAGFAGIHLGYGILWACLLGAFLKWILNEGLARYQIANGKTLFEGAMLDLGSIGRLAFLFYLILWTFFVSGALINACGAAGANLFPLGFEHKQAKVFWGFFHSFIAMMLVYKGGFKKFEKIMSFLVGVMFLTVIFTAFSFIHWNAEFLLGLFTPSSLFKNNPKSWGWTLGILGGVGGTLTILSYGYWLKEKQRSGKEGLHLTRKDLALSYFLTASFSLSMVIIGHEVGSFEGPKSLFPMAVADVFAKKWGSLGQYIFLFGFWGGVFSSMLGVWQSVPFIFCDYYHIEKNRKKLESESRLGQQGTANYSNTKAYRYYLLGMALIPLLSLFYKFDRVQLLYAILGAWFMPLLAAALIILTNKKSKLGDYKSNVFFNTAYVSVFFLFVYLALRKMI